MRTNVIISLVVIHALLIERAVFAKISSNAIKEPLPVVITTWNFFNATNAAWEHIISESGTAVDAVVVGCSVCEEEQCDGSVGYGGSPDENGETTLDAMIMDGVTHDAAAVGGMRSIKNAIGVAHAVLKHSRHTMLVGSLATEFAVSMGFPRTNLSTEQSLANWRTWRTTDNCQPNFWQDVTPDPTRSCGPYSPSSGSLKFKSRKQPKKEIKKRKNFDRHHDTIGMLVIDKNGNIGGGTSTNGANHKIPGRVGDSPIIGSGAYVLNGVGGAAGTGDGDIMMRFSPSFHSVELMRTGMTPTNATRFVIDKIARYYPSFSGALIAVTTAGEYGASCHGMPPFPFTVRSPDTSETQLITVNCT